MATPLHDEPESVDGQGSEGREKGASAAVLQRFKALIREGKLNPGCRLPPERELAKQFGVNRGTLRQTLKLLETLGILSQRVGDGTYVNSTAESVLDQPIELMILLGGISVEERYEARRIVEPELAARAAESAGVGDLAALRNALERLAASGNADERRSADLEFHEAIFRAAGNRMCHLIFSVLHRSVGIDYMARVVPLSDAVEAHRAIYEAIAARNAAGAHEAMARHLDCCAAVIPQPIPPAPLSVEDMGGPLTGVRRRR